MRKVLWAIIFGLFVSSTANAEGAWVLWEKTAESGLPSEWKTVVAYPKYEQCIARQKKDFDIIKTSYSGYKIQIASPETITIERRHENSTLGSIVISLKCFPDTIDPRGDKK
jgi:hypothetical protein